MNFDFIKNLPGVRNITWIDEAAQFYKMWSVQVLAIAGLAQVLHLNWDTYSTLVPPQYQDTVLTALVAVAGLARLIKQKNIVR